MEERQKDGCSRPIVIAGTRRSGYVRLPAADASDGSAVPFGSYYAAAVKDLPDGGDAWEGGLESLARGASSFTLLDGEQQAVTLHVR